MPRPWPAAILISLISLSSAAAALTVFRLGGADQPPPQLEVPFDFVPLSWADFVDPHGSSAQDLNLTGNFIAPLDIKPQTNLALSLREGTGLTYLWFGDWREINNNDRAFFLYNMIDSDPATVFWERRDMVVMLDFGRLLHLRRLRFTTPEKDGHFVPAYTVGHNDGDHLKDGHRPHIPRHLGRQQYDEFFDFELIEQGRGRGDVDLQFSPIRTRRLLLEISSPSQRWEIGEVEVYGTGVVPHTRYLSKVIDLERPLVLGQLSWAGAQGDGADIELRWRHGDDDDPNQYWRRTFRGDEQVPFSTTGEPLSRTQYEQLEPGARGDIRADATNWQSWSVPVDFDAGTSASIADRPRQFAQFEVLFTSSMDQGGRLDFVQFAASAPLVSRAVAEIEPNRATAGEATAFVYKLKPQLEPEDRGFDSLAIQTPARVLSVDPVGRIDGREVPLVTEINASGFGVQIPHFGPQQTGELIEIAFRAKVFAYATPFLARLIDSTAPFEIAQPALEGNADEGNESRTVRVSLNTLPRRALGSLRLSASVLTPNGDGANDVVRIEYEVLNLTERTPVKIEIYDLAGRRVAGVDTGSATSGAHSAWWDGSGPNGDLLVPGVYLLQLEIASDTRMHRTQRLLALAY